MTGWHHPCTRRSSASSDGTGPWLVERPGRRFDTHKVSETPVLAVVYILASVG